MFHWYGFIVGVAVTSVIAGLEVVANRSLPQKKLPINWKQLVVLLVCTLIGARLWHLLTDWRLYQGTALWHLVAVWQGGISILGGLIGLVMGVYLAIPHRARRRWVLDALALTLPIGQAIGRLANYVNQELYGLPATIPWKIYIAPEHRLSGFESVSYYHPLFAYELVGMLLLAAALWSVFLRHSWKVGSGWFFACYVGGYAAVRFGLDFWRLDRPEVWSGLGANQLFLVLVVSLFVVWLGKWWHFQGKSWLFWLQTGSLLVALYVAAGFLGVTVSSWRQSALSVGIAQRQIAPVLTGRVGLEFTDHQLVTIHHGDQTHIFEVVNSDESREQGLSDRRTIGADGMLFIFPRADRWVFWMKDMHFDLDFIWLYEGKVVEITSQVAAPKAGTPITALRRYAPAKPANMVLEIPSSQAESQGWKVGDMVLLP